MKTENAQRNAAYELARRVIKMTEEERDALIKDLGAITTIEGHPLSPMNTFLASSQRAEVVTVVGGFKQWIKVGRCVSKGAKALWIYAPLPRKEGEKQAFTMVPVFDVGQTEVLKERAA